MFGLIGALGLGGALIKESVGNRKAQREYDNKIAVATAQYGKYGKIHHEIFRWHGGSAGKTPYETAKIKACDLRAMYEYPFTKEEEDAVLEWYRTHPMRDMDQRIAIKYRLDTGKYLEEVVGFSIKPRYADRFIEGKKRGL